MKRSFFVFVFCFLVSFLCHAAGGRRPNVLLVMVDDMGFSDLGCYGGEIDSPHIDSLAATGLRFSQFYNTGRCWSTRASLMTGLYPHEAGHASQDRKSPYRAYQGTSPDICPFVSELLKKGGYRTYHVGKWHLQGKDNLWPLQRGFDRSYCVKRQDNFFNPVQILDEGKLVKRPGDTDPDYYITDVFNARALQYLDEHFSRHGEQPFFLYLAHTAPHFPLQAPAKTVAKYRNTFRVGWDAVRKSRESRLSEMGLINCELSARDPDVPAWADLSEADKEMWSGRMAVHAAMIDHVDQGIGKIIENLKRHHAFENTLLFFLSDNGASAEYIVRGDGNDPTAPLGSAKTYRTLEVGWANAANAPFRMYKIWNHEGGIATPLIVHWPEGLAEQEQNGAITHEMGHVIDIVPTILDAAGLPFPKKISGRSLMPVFQGKSRDPNHPIFWEHVGNRAVRIGDWKLVAEFQKPWELYDLSKDRAEMNNLVKKYPDKAAEMAATWQEWADRVGVVLPLKQRQYSPEYRRK